MKPTLRDIAESQKEVLDEITSLRDRVSKVEGVCAHCTSLQAGESAALKLERRGNGGEARVILAFLSKHWRAILTVSAFAYLWIQNHTDPAGVAENGKKIQQLQTAIEFLLNSW